MVNITPGRSMSNRAALYVRVSSDKQADNYSPTTQLQAMREYADAHGYTVAQEHVYREVHTATELYERPELKRVREAMRQDKFDILICFDPDRFSRSQVHTVMLQHFCEQAGVELKFAMFDFEKNATGQFMLSARAFAAELELEKLKERTMRGKRARVEAGKLLPGCRPLYGYRFIANRTAYEPDPLTAPIVRRIFTEAAAGQTMRGIAARLTAEGLPTPSGKAGAAWQHTTVRWIVTNLSYTGEANAWRYMLTRDRQRNTRRALLRPVEEQIPLPAGTIPSLVDSTTFAAIQERLRLNKERAVRNNPHPESALLRAGFLRCGECGAAMSAQTLKDGAVLYRCSSLGRVGQRCNHGMRAHHLDPIVWGRIEGILTRPELIAEQLSRQAGQLEASDLTGADLAAVARALADVERQRRNVARLATLVDDEDAAEPLLDQLRMLAERGRQLEAEKTEIMRQRAIHDEARARITSLTEWCATVAANLGDVTYAEKRLALEALGVQVQLWGANHEPRYAITARIPLGENDIVDSKSW